MKVAVVGHKDLVESDLALIAEGLMPFVMDPEVEELLFAGTEGVSTAALVITLQLLANKPQRPRLTLVMPERVDSVMLWTETQPVPRAWAGHVDQVIELGNPLQGRNGHKGFHLLGEYLVKEVATCGQLLAFWNGNRRTATGYAVRFAQQIDAAWQHVPIVGEQ